MTRHTTFSQGPEDTLRALAPPRFNRRLIPAIAALSTPTVGVFTLLATTEQIAVLPAVIGALAVLFLTILLLRPYGSDLDETAAYIRAVAKGENLAQPEPRTVLAADVLAAVGGLRLAWRTRLDEMESLIGFHHSIFAHLPDPLLLVNHQRKIVAANPAAQHIFGRLLEGRDIAAVLRNALLLEAADRVIKGEPGVDVDFSIATPVEHEFRARVQPLPKVGPDGARVIIALHDVTALKRMEQMRADFVANASHELRTPLSALLGFIETLRGPARDDEEARERFLGIMFEQASRMSRLVADLLNLSRIELNEHTPPNGHADVSQIVTRVAEGLVLQARERDMVLDLNLADDLPMVTGQDDELAQIFQNLMDNALKYGRDGTSVEITAEVTSQVPATLSERLNRAVRVSVRDHGDGIAKEHIPRLTERFFRVDTARSRRLGGTGLGLAIVKHVVNRHRGALVIDSAPGQGSTFTVYLPLAED